MAQNVAARRQAGWLIVGLLPDVCKTPLGSATPPAPYPVIARLESAEQTVSSVRANGQPLVVYDQSYAPATLGDAPGTAKGVVSGTVEGACHPHEHSVSVRAGGKYLVRHGDTFWMNGP